MNSFLNLNNYDKLFKIIIIGESGVGKSSLALKVSKNIFYENYVPTIGFETLSLYFRLNEKYIKMEIWDACGQEAYRSLIKNYYKGASLIILVYSINDMKSFNKLKEWINNIREINENVKIFLIGNKIDKEEQRKITKEMGEKFYQNNKLNSFFEASAKTGYNINDIFIQAVKILYDDIKDDEFKLKAMDDYIIIEEKNQVSHTCNDNCC